MTLTINDEPHHFARELTAAELLAALGKDPTKLALEVNRIVIPRAEQPNFVLKDGDCIEIVTLVGGG